jgi:hypothetical protein
MIKISSRGNVCSIDFSFSFFKINYFQNRIKEQFLKWSGLSASKGCFAKEYAALYACVSFNYTQRRNVG